MPLYELAEQVGAALAARGLRLVTAESCTGGWVAKTITDVPNSSQWFDRGFVTYSNEAKQEMLGVAAATLREHGAVSAATVREMARGALAHSRADLAVAISGIAGPGGGSADKPVGTVWLAWARRDAQPRALRVHLEGDRAMVREGAAVVALQGVVDALERD
ncbi:nicotinamide-nucleotide amidase [Ectothiorhodospiraceae bacterium 2226]|nr:nicotinamide-nucleotide amidase [Ectothiorhodospiraceae bacterium 2226]